NSSTEGGFFLIIISVVVVLGNHCLSGRGHNYSIARGPNSKWTPTFELKILRKITECKGLFMNGTFSTVAKHVSAATGDSPASITARIFHATQGMLYKMGLQKKSRHIQFHAILDRISQLEAYVESGGDEKLTVPFKVYNDAQISVLEMAESTLNMDATNDSAVFPKANDISDSTLGEIGMPLFNSTEMHTANGNDATTRPAAQDWTIIE
ncbi:hypothetical protein PMAYCL1PPCAC_11526, partial [Pristionchus mayeri]